VEDSRAVVERVAKGKEEYIAQEEVEEGYPAWENEGDSSARRQGGKGQEEE
jgi:hypothetical protein